MLKRWEKTEDLFLIENIKKPIKTLSNDLNRSIFSIKNRKKHLKLTINDKWSFDEIEILNKNYHNSDKIKLLSMLPNRNWEGILAKAKTLKLNRLYFYHNSLKNHKIEKLLNDSLESYYFIGLLMADGYFTERSIFFSQTINDGELVDNFANYIESDKVKINKGVGNIIINGKKTFGNDVKLINATDINIIPQLLEKFNIQYERNKKTKTYYPPNIKLFNEMNNDFFISYLIGFIDGDGHISKTVNNGNSITIRVHKNWFDVLNNWKERIEVIYGCNLSVKSLKLENDIVNLRIYNKKIILELKQFIQEKKLKVSNRKWVRIK